MLNRTLLVGRLTRDPELRFSPNGVAVCSFTIAVNRFGKRDEADFPSIVCFKKTAENTANFCKKGSLVGIDGRLQTRTYDGQNGKVYVTEIVAESVQFLEPKNGGGSNTSPSQENRSQGQRNPQGDPFAREGETIDISDDDLPF